MGNCKTKPRINAFSKDVGYHVDGYLAVKFGAMYVNGGPAGHQTKTGELETMMNLWTSPSPVRKSPKSESDMEMDTESLSVKEINMYATPLQSSTNNIHEMSISSPSYFMLENQKETSIGDCTNSVKVSKQFETIQEKYHSTKLDRDQLVKKNLILSKDLQKAEALNAKKLQENEQLVQQSQNVSAHWKKQATTIQTENAELVENLENMCAQLECLVPENFTRVKQQQNSMVEERAFCEISTLNEIDQRQMLEKARNELEIKLKREKAKTIANLQAQEMVFRNIIKKHELEKIELEKQIKDVTLGLQKNHRRADIVEKEGKLLKRRLEQHWLEDEQLPASLNVETLTSEDEASLLLSYIIEQVGMQRKYIGKLHELCNPVVIERDRTMEEIELLKFHLGEDFTNEETVSVYDRQSTIESAAEDEISESERLKQKLFRRTSSHQNLAAKIRVLQMESRHKSKIIQLLQQEQFDEYGSVVQDESQGGSNVNRSQEKWEYTRYQVFDDNGENVPKSNSESAELGDDEADNVISRVQNFFLEMGSADNESIELYDV